MNIVLFNNSFLPAQKYGGTERVVYSLATELKKLGHSVTLLIKGLTKQIPFETLIYNENIPFMEQIPEKTDIIHLHSNVAENITIPYVITLHGNKKDSSPLDKNTIFVSKNHATRHGSNSYVLNGLDWEEYTKVDFSKKREHYHFLGKAAWRVKNVKDAIDIAVAAGEKVEVLGGKRFNFKMGIRFTFTPKATFHGMIGGKEKEQLLNTSKGLIFPVLWHEPFGLAITESLYFGAPVFATPYGSLKELIHQDVGFLSTDKKELIDALKNNSFKPKVCHEYARDMFNSKVMALEYLNKYEQVLNGHPLNAVAPQLKDTSETKFLPLE